MDNEVNQINRGRFASDSESEKSKNEFYLIEGYIQVPSQNADGSETPNQLDSPTTPTKPSNGTAFHIENGTSVNSNHVASYNHASKTSDVLFSNGISEHDVLLSEEGLVPTSQTVISCHNLGYSVQVSAKGSKCCCRSQEKVILQGINGLFKPGLNAILGATGSGKTSLLDTLAGRKNPDGMTGHVLVNGQRQPKNFNCMTGYVVQDDKVMGTLTVRENIMFSANLRLRKHISAKQKKQMVEDTIQELGLDRCADTKVGNEFIRGVSGGERKRCNIGMELIVSPHLLFLDEPTSGLDSNTANAVVRLLSKISKRGRTIIFSIHQPRYSIYKLFDTLFLLARGKTVYHGPMSDALDYFTRLGYACESHNNPSDFFLDIMNGDPEVIRPHTRRNLSLVKTDEKKSLKNGLLHSETEQLAIDYTRSHSCHKVNSELAIIYKQYEASDKKTNGAYGEYANSFPTQLKYLAKRTVTNILRNPAAILFQVITMVIQAMIGGLLYYDLGREVPVALQNRAGFFFFASMSSAFPNMAAIELFIKDRAFYVHEHSNGFYGPTAYFISKILFDFLPMRLMPTVLYAAISYFMIKLKRDFSTFLFYNTVLCVASLTTVSMSFCAGLMTEIYAVAHAVTALSLIVSAMFAGLLVNLDSLPSWIQWVKYLSYTRYGFSALLINEVRDEDFLTFNVSSGAWDIEVPAGNEYLESLHINYETEWDKWSHVIGISVLGLACLIVSYIQLRRLNKYK